MDRLDEAWDLVCQATERFPLLPRLWVDRAFVCRAREDWDGARESLETAYEINPGWGYAARLLCDLHERSGNLLEARRLMELAIRRSPLDSWNHVALADIFSRERSASAIQLMHQAVQIEPGNDARGERLHRWSREYGQPDQALEAVRELTRRRPGEGRSWMLLARALSDIHETDECLRTLDQAITLNPQYRGLRFAPCDFGTSRTLG